MIDDLAHVPIINREVITHSASTMDHGLSTMDSPYLRPMTDFQLFFSEGFQHITDLNGVDHIVFIAALTSTYLYSDWKKLLVLITAFTIGHSVILSFTILI